MVVPTLFIAGEFDEAVPSSTRRFSQLVPGAEFVVMVCGDIMTMPGLPKVASAELIDLDEDGRVVGLF